MPTNIVYPFDPTGLLASNLIVNEIKGSRIGGLYSTAFIVPDAAPFFRTGLTITNISTNQPLVEGVDYILTHRFHDASVQTSKDVYGSISLLANPAVNYRLSYQTVGGVWVLSTNEVLDELYNRQFNPRMAYWEQVVDLPTTFPVINHGHEFDDYMTPVQIGNKLQGIVEAIQERNAQQSTFATMQEAIDGINTTKQMNPALTKSAIDSSSNTLASAVTTSFLVSESITHDFINDFFGDFAFVVGTGLGDSFKVSSAGGNITVAAGLAYIRGVRVYKGTTTPMGSFSGSPKDLWMIVLLPNGTTYMDAAVTFFYNDADTSLAYSSPGRTYYAFKLSKITNAGTLSDLRITFGRISTHPVLSNQGSAIVQNLQPKPERINVSGELLKIGGSYICDASSSSNLTLQVILPPTTGLLLGDAIDLTRFIGQTVQIDVYNSQTDTIVMELPDGTITSPDTQALYNISTVAKIIWHGTFWGI